MVFQYIIANEYQGGNAADKKQFVGKESHIFCHKNTVTAPHSLLVAANLVGG